MGYFINHKDAISVFEAAKKYNYHPVTLRNWANKKIIRSLRDNGKIYLYESELKAYINWLLSCQLFIVFPSSGLRPEENIMLARQGFELAQTQNIANKIQQSEILIMSAAITTTATTLAGQFIEVASALQAAEIAALAADPNAANNVNITSDSDDGQIVVNATIPASLSSSGGNFALTPDDYV